MNVLSSHFERRRRQVHEQWPGFRAFWPGIPIGVAAGLPLFFGLRIVWPEPVAFAGGLFVTLAAFLLSGLFRAVPRIREFWGMGILIVLGISAAGVGLTMLIGYAVGNGMQMLFQFVGGIK